MQLEVSGKSMLFHKTEEVLAEQGFQRDLKTLLDFGRAQEGSESQACQMNNGNSINNNGSGHVYAVNSKKKEGRVKA